MPILSAIRNPVSGIVAGSSLWQTIFVSFALVLIAFEIVRGWRLGIVRQLVRLLALFSAYAAGLFGGRMLLPLLRPLVRVPDLFISIVAGAVLALIIYGAINTIGAILFKRTGQQSAGIVRLLYGLCGAALGVFFGLFSVWLIVVAIRSIGAIANAELHSVAAQRQTAPLRARPGSSPNEAQPMLNSVAKLKNSIELGSLGETVKAVDVVPAQTYQTLGKLGTIVSNPQSAERFLSYPGAKELTKNPKILALRNDPEIIELIQQQRFMDLLQHPRLIDAMNDPALAAQVRSFDFQKALDYAMKR
jgi:membrane protein required for colicin V production